MLSIDNYVVDVLLRDLVGHDRRPVAFLVYLWFAAQQQSEDQQSKNRVVQVSYQEVAENIGVSKSSVQSAVRWLIRRKLLAATKENATSTPRYKVLTPWRDTARRSSPRE